MTASISARTGDCEARTRFTCLLRKPAGQAGDMLVPEETVFGIVSRYHVLSGYRAAGDTIRELLRRRAISLNTSIPSGLNLILEQLALPINTVEELIEDHTILPYFRSFSDPTNYAGVVGSAAIGDASRTKISLGLLASRVGAHDVLRYCPACAEADESTIGVATWYRVHQLPGVLVCPYHRTLLVANHCLAQRLKRQQLFLPADTAKWPGNSSDYKIDGRTLDKLFLIAQLSAQLLVHRQAPSGTMAWRNQYLIHFVERELATPSLRVRQRELRSEFTDFWSAVQHVAPFSQLLERCANDDPWLTKLYRKPRSAHHPLMHVLLIGFLAQSVESFLCARAKPSLVASASNAQTPEPAEAKIAMLVAQGRSLRQVAAEAGLSINSVLVKAQKLGVIIKRRPKKLDAETVSQVCTSLADGKSIAGIVRVSKLSASTVNRILGGDRTLQAQRAASIREKRGQHARNNLLAAIANAPTAGIKTLRATLPSDFAWLYRHDRAWLYDHLPAAAKTHPYKLAVDWNARDDAMRKEVEKAVTEILNPSQRPVRISVNEIGRRTSHASWIEKHLAKLPRTSAFLAHVLEPVHAFQARRLAWWEQQLGSENMPRWRIFRAAGLRHDPNEIGEEGSETWRPRIDHL